MTIHPLWRFHCDCDLHLEILLGDGCMAGQHNVADPVQDKKKRQMILTGIDQGYAGIDLHGLYTSSNRFKKG